MNVSIGSNLQKRITDFCNYWFTDLVSFTSSRNSSLHMSCFSSFRCHLFYHYLNRSVFINMAALASPVHAICLSNTYVVNRSFHLKRSPTACRSVYMRIAVATVYNYSFFCVSVLMQRWTVFMEVRHFLVPVERCFSAVGRLDSPVRYGVMSRTQESSLKIRVILVCV